LSIVEIPFSLKDVIIRAIEIMKKYSSARAGRGKTAYRTPSDFRFRHFKEIERRKIKKFCDNKK